MITTVNSWILTNTYPLYDFQKKEHGNSLYRNGHFQENRENHIQVEFVKIREFILVIIFVTFPQKQHFWLKNESFENSRNLAYSQPSIRDSQTGQSDQVLSVDKMSLIQGPFTWTVHVIEGSVDNPNDSSKVDDQISNWTVQTTKHGQSAKEDGLEIQIWAVFFI